MKIDIKNQVAIIKRKAEAEVRVDNAREFYRGQIAACQIVLDAIKRSEK